MMTDLLSTVSIRAVSLVIQWAYKLPSLNGPILNVAGETKRRDVRRLVREAAPGLGRLLDGHLNGDYYRTQPVPWTDWVEVPPHPDLDDDHVYVNSRYQVNMRFLTTFGLDGYVHLSIKKLLKEPHVDWRDMQKIKNDLCGEQREAVEIYPAESRLVDTSNQYHLWVLPRGEQVPFGFEQRMVMDNDDLESDDGPLDPGGATQRKFNKEAR